MSENVVLGYAFKNAALLDEALTTPSYRQDHPQAHDNQRLEFLGDAVLGLLAANYLYANKPDLAEGPLTVCRTHMVSSAALCAAAARLSLESRLKRNAAAVPLSPQAKTLADAVEAVMGAAWLDGGLAAAETIFKTLDLTSAAEQGAWADNPKGELQIRAQALMPPRLPKYTTLSTTGVSHAPIFTVRVEVEALGSAVASAHSRREAESAAAAVLLARVAKNKEESPINTPERERNQDK